jgi:uncharacterized protein YjbJ (UPF0337 family)
MHAGKFRSVLHDIQTGAYTLAAGLAVTSVRGWSASKGQTMNTNQVKGTAKGVAGKVQQKVGEITGNKSQQVKGAAKQVEGAVQKGVGNVEQALDKADRQAR